MTGLKPPERNNRKPARWLDGPGVHEPYFETPELLEIAQNYSEEILAAPPA